MIEKILALTFAVLFLIAATLAFVFNWQKNKLGAKVVNLEATIFIQNEAIKKNELDLKNFKAKQPFIDKQIETKYEKVIIKDETCEQERQSIKNLLEIFFEKEM